MSNDLTSEADKGRGSPHSVLLLQVRYRPISGFYSLFPIPYL